MGNFDQDGWNFAGEPAGPLEKVHIPGLSRIEDICCLLKISPQQFLKTSAFHANSPILVRWVVAVVRGDHELDDVKLLDAARELGVTSIRTADLSHAHQKFAIGFVGPDAGTTTPDAVLIVDPAAAQGIQAWATGANEIDFYVRYFNWFREAGDQLANPAKVLVTNIALR